MRLHQCISFFSIAVLSSTVESQLTFQQIVIAASNFSAINGDSFSQDFSISTVKVQTQLAQIVQRAKRYLANNGLVVGLGFCCFCPR